MDIYKSYCVLGEMMEARGYCNSATYVEMKFDEFEEKIKNESLDCSFVEPMGQRIYVFFSLSGDSIDKITKRIQLAYQTQQSRNIDFDCVVISHGISIPLESLKYVSRFEQFTFEELQFNPLRHILVPKHILYTSKQQMEYLRKNPSIRVEDLPVISTNDIIMRFLGAEEHQIVKIERKANIDGFRDSDSVIHRYVQKPLVSHNKK